MYSRLGTDETGNSEIGADKKKSPQNLFFVARGPEKVAYKEKKLLGNNHSTPVKYQGGAGEGWGERKHSLTNAMK